MFYSDTVLSIGGKLGPLWQAAHWAKQLRRAVIESMNIQDSCNDILNPEVPLALRTSGHLMLGVARIYSLKAKYLLNSCRDTQLKLKMSYRPGAVDLPESSTANFNAITLQENTDAPELFIQIENRANKARHDDITLPIDPFMMDFQSNYPDSLVFEPEVLRSAPDDDESILDSRKTSIADFSRSSVLTGGDKSIIEQAREDYDSNSFTAAGSAFPEAFDDNMGYINAFQDDDYFNGGGGGAAFDEEEQRLEDERIANLQQNVSAGIAAANRLNQAEAEDSTDLADNFDLVGMNSGEVKNRLSGILQRVDPKPAAAVERRAAPVAGVRVTKSKLLIDEQYILESGKIKAQLADASATTMERYMGPRTRRFMQLQEMETQTAEMIFNLPNIRGLSNALQDFLGVSLSFKPSALQNESAIELMRNADESIAGGDSSTINYDVGHGGGYDDDYYAGDFGMPTIPEGDDESVAVSRLSLKRGFDDPDMSPGKRAQFDADDSIYDRSGADLGDEMNEMAQAIEGTDTSGLSADDKIWSQRTKNVHGVLQSKFTESDILSFDNFAAGNSRRLAAGLFFELLVLKSMGKIELEQEMPYGDISIMNLPLISH